MWVVLKSNTNTAYWFKASTNLGVATQPKFLHLLLTITEDISLPSRKSGCGAGQVQVVKKNIMPAFLFHGTLCSLMNSAPREVLLLPDWKFQVWCNHFGKLGYNYKMRFFSNLAQKQFTQHKGHFVYAPCSLLPSHFSPGASGFACCLVKT